MYPCMEGQISVETGCNVQHAYHFLLIKHQLRQAERSFKAVQIVRSDLNRPYLRYRPSLHELKVRKNGQQKTCNLFCNIAAKRVEQRCCHSAFLFFDVQQYYKADTQSQSVSSFNHDVGSSFIFDRDQSYSSYFVKCRRTPIQLKSSEPYPSSETEKNFVVARLRPP